MAKVKANKAVVIDSIIKEIENGESRGKVLGKIGKKWEISRTTFDRYWKTANEQHRELQDRAKDAADASYIKATEKAAERGVMSKAERLEVLSNIARGEVFMAVKVEGEELPKSEQVPIEIVERLKAIAELNKMDGSYAPAKVANTDKDGNDIQVTIFQLPDNGRN